MSTPEFPRVEESESSNAEFQKELVVTVGGERQSFSYRFFYKVEENNVKLLGRPAGGSSSVTLDDDHFDSFLAERGLEALKLAKSYIQNLHPQIKRFSVQPEVLEWGRYLVWNMRHE